MRLGILGLPKAGKTTLFNTLTAAHQATDKFATSTRTNVAVAAVPDRRLERLRDLFRPRRFVPATVTYVDVPGLRKGEGPESLDVAELKTVDAFLHVVRAFDDPEIVHPEGSVDPQRDVASVDLELILADHTLVERRLERLQKAGKRGLAPEEEREQALLADVILPALEAERPLREIALAAEDERRLKGFQLLSAKPMLVVVNAAEAALRQGEELARRLPLGAGVEALVASAPIEEEISRLEATEQREFLAELGLAEGSLDRILRASYALLGLVSFFTVGEDEVRAWTIRRGTRAREAAGVIHTDLERGFIRAEVVGWEDLVRLTSLAACRERGLLRLEGKDYEVKDGDVMNIRFNV
jgi:GTP-binding protein YchF